MAEQSPHPQQYGTSNAQAADPIRFATTELDRPNRVLDIPTVPQELAFSADPLLPRGFVEDVIIAKLTKAVMKWASKSHEKACQQTEFCPWDNGDDQRSETASEWDRREWLKKALRQVTDTYDDEELIIRKAILKYGLIMVAVALGEMGVDAGVITAIVEHEKKKKGKGKGATGA